MNQNSLLTETFLAISKDFDIQNLDLSLLHKDENAFLTEIKNYLTDKIRILLENDVERLLTILYRIDVHEDIVKKVFSDCDKNEIPLHIANIIIERQMSKIKTRQQYKNENV